MLTTSLNPRDVAQMKLAHHRLPYQALTRDKVNQVLQQHFGYAATTKPAAPDHAKALLQVFNWHLKRPIHPFA